MKTEALEFINNFCDFGNPNWLWILTGISRNKDNDEQGEKFFHRSIVGCPDDIEVSYDYIHRMTCNPDTSYRMYVSLNSRDAVSTIVNFQKKMIDINIDLFKGTPDSIPMCKRVDSLWKSELAQKRNRGTKRLLLDIDAGLSDAMAIRTFVEQNLKTDILTFHATASYYCMVINACDIRALEAYAKSHEIPLDIQRDSMVFVEKWEGKE